MKRLFKGLKNPYKRLVNGLEKAFEKPLGLVPRAKGMPATCHPLPTDTPLGTPSSYQPTDTLVPMGFTTPLKSLQKTLKGLSKAL